MNFHRSIILSFQVLLFNRFIVSGAIVQSFHCSIIPLFQVLNIAASLLAFTAFIEMLNNLTMWFAGDNLIGFVVDFFMDFLFGLLLTFYLITLVNILIKGHAGRPDLTLTEIMGYIFWPLAFCMGIVPMVSQTSSFFLCIFQL